MDDHHAPRNMPAEAKPEDMVLLDQAEDSLDTECKFRRQIEERQDVVDRMFWYRNIAMFLDIPMMCNGIYRIYNCDGKTLVFGDISVNFCY